ncbi:hypothetical protein [Clavibacter sp. B3I6]|uniref:hypothetical protein n=1 Tax=Clavibacter sp. B3I6 TaxID=3042268 RepID=UPI0027D7EEE0|nr:hypothetical protein [Clavibacter sp. B3I6]
MTITRAHGATEPAFFLEHPFDLWGFDGMPEDGPYPSQEAAESAARLVLEAVCGADD